jgi:polyprenyl-phospho-N-acetylgalactosaminyl synthase
MTEFRPCFLIPTYNNPNTVRDVVLGVREHLPEVVVVNDGSGPETRAVCEALADEGLAHVVHRPQNGGKGAAVKTGFASAWELGYTHAFQVDADGQHRLEVVPRYLEVARANPDALVLSVPVFDASVPKGRQFARSITTFWVNVETGGRIIGDPMCGFRIYPLEATLPVRISANMMDFDPEIAVRLVWSGVPVINLPLPVRYMTREQGGVSHFRLFKDNFLISWMHTRLCLEKIFGTLIGRRYRGTVRELEAGR